jgi:hypothetical protein
MEKYFDKTDDRYSKNINLFNELNENDQKRVVDWVIGSAKKLDKEIYISHITKNKSCIQVTYSFGMVFK